MIKKFLKLVQRESYCTLFTYYDIGGMGPNSNKSFVSNISGSNNYLSMEIAFSSYEGEKLGDFLKNMIQTFVILL